jgi:hypothetical protein
MEYLAGACLIAIGLFFLPFGARAAPSRESAPQRPRARSGWVDVLVLWGMTIACLCFGAALLSGRVRF